MMELFIRLHWKNSDGIAVESVNLILFHILYTKDFSEQFD